MLMFRAAVLLAFSYLTVLGFPGIPLTEYEEEEASTSSLGLDIEAEAENVEPVRGNVRVVRVLPGAFAESLLFRRARADLPSPSLGLPSVLHRAAQGTAFRSPFLIRSRAAAPGQALGAIGRLHSPARVEELQREQKNAPDLWRRVIQKGNRAQTVLPLTQSDISKSSCKAIPFTQTISRESCAPAKIQNRFCFGQCSSFYVPGTLTGASRPCSGCAPSRIRRITVPLHCENEVLVREEAVTLVEECQCEAQGETDALRHLSALSLQG
ncbi:DAN domain family member 5 [Lissotriton helveticus]